MMLAVVLTLRKLRIVNSNARANWAAVTEGTCKVVNYYIFLG